MIAKYGIFYHYQKDNDQLVIAFNDLKINRCEVVKDVLVSYHDDILVSYTLTHINRIMKIHINGLISLPNNKMIEVINSFLKKANLETLKEKEHSDFIIGVVKEIEPSLIVLSEGEKFTFNKRDDVKVNDKVVIALKDSFLYDGRFLKDHHLCTYRDLEINDSEALIIDNSLSEDNDFFDVGEK